MAEKVPIIFEIRSVRKTYAQGTLKVLSDVSMNIREGSIFGIIGKSGAGKTTLLRALSGLETLDTGTILFSGQDMRRLKGAALQECRREIGMVFQHFNLLSRRTVAENVALPLEILGKSEEQIEKQVDWCLRQVGLHDKVHAYPSELSGGQKQRVAIARAIAPGARVLLCDEPTSALDVNTTREVLDLLRTLNQTLGLTIVIISHHIGVVKELCHDLCVMHQGQVTEVGPIEQIFTHPKHQTTQALIYSHYQHSIPKCVRERLSETPQAHSKQRVYRLMFASDNAEKPLISEMIETFHTRISILSGHIDHVGTSDLGTLLISMPNEDELLEQAMSFFKDASVEVQFMGYI